jgi:hypothetical protein
MITETASSEELMTMIDDAIQWGGPSEMMDTLASVRHYIERVEKVLGNKEGRH